MKQEAPNFKITLDLNEVNAILTALQELPAKVCNPISDKIKAQAQAQLAEMQVDKTADTQE